MCGINVNVVYLARHRVKDRTGPTVGGSWSRLAADAQWRKDMCRTQAMEALLLIILKSMTTKIVELSFLNVVPKFGCLIHCVHIMF